MGLFGKKKPKMGQPSEDGQVHVQGMMADPAAFGGPSTASVAADDPIWEPIDGVSIEQYAQITKGAADQGISDEAGALAFAAQQGVSEAAFQSAMAGWNERMKASMAVGQRFNALYMGR